jgi:DNA-directed RNA polymerase subunit M/transcription elongation factor TFIIS
MFRQKGKQALQKVLKNQKNIDVIENNVFKKSEGSSTVYLDNIYQVVGFILNNESLKEVLTQVKENKLGFNNKLYDNTKHKLKEFDEYLVKPFEVEEGIIACNKCGSKKTFSIGKTTRSLDEPTTTFSTCSECMNQWTSNG